MIVHSRRGLMTQALRLCTAFAFSELGLHRLEANIQPTNAASIALVRRVGFRKEGFSPRYLMIDEMWCDHERWALLADDPED
jgi:[ribosomal protein S5]-alanine N-acetyltransferase